MPTTAIREKTINLRATPAQKALIERAAESMGKTHTAFILDVTLQQAEAVLPTAPADAWRDLMFNVKRYTVST